MTSNFLMTHCSWGMDEKNCSYVLIKKRSLKRYCICQIIFKYNYVCIELLCEYNLFIYLFCIMSSHSHLHTFYWQKAPHFKINLVNNISVLSQPLVLCELRVPIQERVAPRSKQHKYRININRNTPKGNIGQQ